MSSFLLLMSLLATQLMQNGSQCLYHLKQCEIASPLSAATRQAFLVCLETSSVVV